MPSGYHNAVLCMEHCTALGGGANCTPPFTCTGCKEGYSTLRRQAGFYICGDVQLPPDPDPHGCATASPTAARHPTAAPTPAPTTAGPTVASMRVVSGSQYCSISGMCATEGAGNHGNNERCTIEVLTGGTLSSTEFYTEPCCEVTRCHRPPSPPFTPPPPIPPNSGPGDTQSRVDSRPLPTFLVRWLRSSRIAVGRQC